MLSSILYAIAGRYDCPILKHRIEQVKGVAGLRWATGLCNKIKFVLLSTSLALNSFTNTMDILWSETKNQWFILFIRNRFQSSYIEGYSFTNWVVTAQSVSYLNQSGQHT